MGRRPVHESGQVEENPQVLKDCQDVHNQAGIECTVYRQVE
jgi:hypothetical protein